jgi:hypothetical protein
MVRSVWHSCRLFAQASIDRADSRVSRLSIRAERKLKVLSHGKSDFVRIGLTTRGSGGASQAICKQGHDNLTNGVEQSALAKNPFVIYLAGVATRQSLR